MGVAVGVAVGVSVGEEVGFDEGLAEGLEDSEELVAVGLAERLEDSEGLVEGDTEGPVDAEGLALVEGDAEGPVDAEGRAVKTTSPPTPLKAFHSRLGEHISVSASTSSRKRGNMIYEIHDCQLTKIKYGNC